MAEQSITLMFNSKNGEVIGGFPTNEAPPITLKDVKFKTLSYDPDVYAWVGTYDNGKLEKIEYDTTKQVIDEEELDQNVKENIEGLYPAYKQMNIIIEMLNQSSIPNTEDFQKMYDFIKDEREKNDARKEVYKAEGTPYEFVDKESIQENVRKRLDIE